MGERVVSAELLYLGRHAQPHHMYLLGRQMESGRGLCGVEPLALGGGEDEVEAEKGGEEADPRLERAGAVQRPPTVQRPASVQVITAPRREAPVVCGSGRRHWRRRLRRRLLPSGPRRRGGRPLRRGSRGHPRVCIRAIVHDPLLSRVDLGPTSAIERDDFVLGKTSLADWAEWAAVGRSSDPLRTVSGRVSVRWMQPRIRPGSSGRQGGPAARGRQAGTL